MSDQPPRKAAQTLLSPDTTLVAPAAPLLEDTSSGAAKTKQTHDDGSEKTGLKAVPKGSRAQAAPLIPASEPLHAAAPRAGSDRQARGRRNFFRPGSTDGAAARGRLDPAAEQQRAQEMQMLERRLKMQRQRGPSAAEAEQRLRQLQHDTRKAATARGPRVAQGVFQASCATDLCFVLDVTGSMQSYIDTAQKSIKTIVDEINRAFFHEADVRVAVVAYRDHDVRDRDHTLVLPFTDNVYTVYGFLRTLFAHGGADMPEDVLGGLDAALALNWRHPTRCIMHIADAPGHGSALHDLGRDNDYWYDRPEPHGMDWKDVLGRMVAKQINYVFFRITDKTDRMALRFLRAYAAAAPDAQLCRQNRYCLEAGLEMQRLRTEKAGADSGSGAGAGAGAGTVTSIGGANNGDTFVSGALNGGLHFEEVMLGVSYSTLSQLVVGGVMASSSRTAVRLSATASTARSGGSSSSGLRSKQAAYQKAKLGDVPEDAELEVLDEAEEQPGGDSNDKTTGGGGFDTATTRVGTAAAEADTIVADTTVADSIVLETGPPEWEADGWLDQTIKCKAFSPDVVDMQRMHGGGGGGGGGGSSRAGQILDLMMESDDNIPLSTTELTVLRRSRPFAQGALRTASYARTQESTNPLVVKTFKRGGKTLADLAEDMRLQALCKAFALEFNGLVANENYSLDFVVVTCLQPHMDDNGDNDNDDGCLTLEPLLLETDAARYVKYNNNCGGVSRLGVDPTGDGDGDGDADAGTKHKAVTRPEKEAEKEAKAQAKAQAKADSEARRARARVEESGAGRARRARRARLAAVNAAAQAFSHFTFERSRGRMLVVDLQGVGNVLTDPAIHTRDPTRFVLSDTNLNDDGFKLFFTTHRCNALCAHLRLRSYAGLFRNGGDGGSGIAGSGPSFAFRASWTPPRARGRWVSWTPARFFLGNSTGYAGQPPDMLVCCANKLCSRIVRASTAKAAPAGVYWCGRCWPQLRSSAVTRVCATLGAYHEFEVSTFFFESQGQILPSTCTAHGGVISQPLDAPAQRRALLQRLSCF